MRVIALYENMTSGRVGCYFKPRGARNPKYL